MAPPLKYLLIILGLMVLAVVGAATALVMNFNPNIFRAQIAQDVHDKTGRNLTIGNIGLSYYPWIRLDLKKVSLSNAPGFGSAPLAQVGEVKVGVRLIPLLFAPHHVDFDNIQINGLALDLERSADGSTNWNLAKKKDQPDTPATSSSDTTSSGSFKLEDIDIGGVDIQDASIEYRDDQKHQHYTIQDLDLKTGDLRPGKAFDVQVTIKAVAGADPLETQTQLSMRVDPNLETRDVKLENLVIDFKAKNAEIDAKARLKAAVHADLKARRIDIVGLDLEGSAEGKRFPAGNPNLQLTGDISLDQASGNGQARNLQLTVGGLQAVTTLALTGLDGSTPHFSGPLTVASFNARELLGKLSNKPLVMQDPKALTQVSFKAQLEGTAKSVKLEDLVLKFDQSTLTGSVNVRDLASHAISFALKMDDLDADRYMAAHEPIAQPREDDAPSLKVRRDDDQTEIPANALTDLDVDGTLDVAALTVRKLHLSDVRLALAGAKGSAKTVSLSGRLYGGTFVDTTRITPGARPAYAIKTNLDNLALGPFMRDLSGKDKVEGIGNIALDLSSSGRTVGEAKRGLAGNVALHFKNGEVKGFDLGEIIRHGRAVLNGTPYTPSTAPPATDFASIDFTGQIVGGILNSDSLDARNPLLRVGGAGRIDLVDETFDYLAKPTIVQSSEGQGGRALGDLGGLTIPVHLTGTFANPKYKVEIGDMVRTQARQQIRQELEDHKDEIRQRLNDRLGSLFGKKKQQQPDPPPSDPQP